MQKLNNIKILVLDLDGTVVNSVFETISKRVQKSIIEAQKRNIKVILNTGRAIKDTLWIVKYLDLEKYNGLVIGLNGSVLFDTKTKKIEIVKELSRKQKEALLSASKIHRISLVFFSNNLECKGFFYKRTFLIFLFALFRKSFRFNKISEIEILNKKFSSGLIIGTNEVLKDFVEFTAKKSESIFFSSGMKNTIQFSLTDKKEGLNLILKKMKIEKNDIMIIGDNLNDLPLFIDFKYTIAMGNSVDEIKNKSFYITKTNIQDGVAFAIEKFLL